MDLREVGTGVVPARHWYYQTKKLPLVRWFDACAGRTGRLNVVDIGAGSGFFSRALLEAFNDRVGRVLLVDRGYSEQELSRGEGKRVERMQALPETISNSVIVMMDVLEHLEDDGALLADVRRRCDGKNYFFATVPAFNFLWSPHDEFLRHFRRYSMAGFTNLLLRNGFIPARAYYLYASIFPVACLTRMLRRRPQSLRSELKPVNSLVNATLRSVVGVESRIAPMNRLFGLTCVAQGSVDR